MRALLQRVSEGWVTIEGKVSGEIGAGLVVLLGIEEADDSSDVDWLVGKICRMRIFGDDEGLNAIGKIEFGGLIDGFFPSLRMQQHF